MNFESDGAEPPPLPVMPEVVVREQRGVWGAWATIGLGFVVVVAWMLAQGVAAVVYLLSEPGVLSGGEAAIMGMLEGLETDAAFLGWATIAGTVVGVPLIFLAAWLKGGLPVMEYLRVKRVKWWVLGFWGLAAVAFLYGFGYGIEDVTKGGKGEMFMRGITESAVADGMMPILYVAVVLAAPLFEECFFRGFVFEGLMRSPLGAWGANVLTALGWTALHIQYGAAELSMLFVGGLLFGYARIRTGSLLTPVMMHVVWNLAAMVGAQVEWG